MLPRKSQLSYIFSFVIVFFIKGVFNLVLDQGQGGAQAIEDGAALGSIFSRFPPFPSIELICARLSLFEDVRKNRASAMQIYSLAGQDEASKIGDLAKEYVKDGVIPSMPAFLLILLKIRNVVNLCGYLLPAPFLRSKSARIL